MSAALPMLPSVYYPSQLRQPTVTNSSASSSSSSSSTNLSPAIIITILILFVTIILTTSLCLLFRHFHRPTHFLSLRGSPRHFFGLQPSSRHLSHHPPSSPATAATGDAASQYLIDSLPLFTFSEVTRRSNTTTSSSAVIEADCAVCLSRFVSNDTLRLLPLCCHAFHSQCINTWLSYGHKTCPLCRSNVYASAALPSASILHPSASSGSPNGSFHLEIGSIRRHHNDSTSNSHRSYTMGSFDYVVEAETDVAVADRHRRSVSENSDGINSNPDVADLNSNGNNAIAGRIWLGEYMDRLSATLSSRTASFRSSRMFFTGSSRRSEVAGVGEWDIEASRVVEEISELFRWASGV